MQVVEMLPLRQYLYDESSNACCYSSNVLLDVRITLLLVTCFLENTKPTHKKSGHTHMAVVVYMFM